jgi:hypothetical protein
MHGEEAIAYATRYGWHIWRYALTFLGRKYRRKKDRDGPWMCNHFIEEVYGNFGLIDAWPQCLDVTDDPPPGMFLKLRRRNCRKDRYWTHMAMTGPFRTIIHNSLRYGGTVSVYDLDELLEEYDIVL